MPVPFLDLRGVNARFAAEFDQAADRVFASGRYLFGEECRLFAEEFAAWNGSAHCVPLANGLDALRLTLRAWLSLGRLMPGDEVIVPVNSFVASALAVTELSLGLVFADVDPDTSCLTAGTVGAAMTKRSRVVMPVHLYGRVDSIQDIGKICAENAMLMLEDCAQAHGAAVGGARAGTFGAAGAFSFYPSKNLGAIGDAGCIVTDDAELAERVKALGNYGSAHKYRHDHLGANSRMDELQAAFLRAKLRLLDSDNSRRRAIAGIYSNRLNHPMIRVPPMPSESSAHVWHLYVIRTFHREALISFLNDNGIESMIHYPCTIHQQAAFADKYGSQQMPVAELMQHQVLSLPMSPIMSDDAVEFVAETINRWPCSP